MPSPRQQLVLPFPYEPAYDPRDFVAAASNQAARAWLDRTQDWPDRRLALWGEAGGGKTHLLRLWAARTGAAVLDGRVLRSPEALPRTGTVAIAKAAESSRIVPSDRPACSQKCSAKSYGAMFDSAVRTRRTSEPSGRFAATHVSPSSVQMLLRPIA